jgi:hypothetical protein
MMTVSRHVGGAVSTTGLVNGIDRIARANLAGWSEGVRAAIRSRGEEADLSGAERVVRRRERVVRFPGRAAADRAQAMRRADEIVRAAAERTLVAIGEIDRTRNRSGRMTSQVREPALASRAQEYGCAFGQPDVEGAQHVGHESS